MEKTEKEGFEIERLIPVNILEDKKQMRITIPKEIVEDFRINPEKDQFAWIVQRKINSDMITITGKFIFKIKNGTKKD